MDPCTPRGYTHDYINSDELSTSLTEKNKYLSKLHPSGNFSECKSASLTLLQKGNGISKFFLYGVISCIDQVISLISLLKVMERNQFLYEIQRNARTDNAT